MGRYSSETVTEPTDIIIEIQCDDKTVAKTDVSAETNIRWAFKTKSTTMIVYVLIAVTLIGGIAFGVYSVMNESGSVPRADTSTSGLFSNPRDVPSPAKGNSDSTGRPADQRNQDGVIAECMHSTEPIGQPVDPQTALPNSEESRVLVQSPMASQHCDQQTSGGDERVDSSDSQRSEHHETTESLDNTASNEQHADEPTAVLANADPDHPKPLKDLDEEAEGEDSDPKSSEDADLETSQEPQVTVPMEFEGDAMALRASETNLPESSEEQEEETVVSDSSGDDVAEVPEEPSQRNTRIGAKGFISYVVGYVIFGSATYALLLTAFQLHGRMHG